MEPVELDSVAEVLRLYAKSLSGVDAALDLPAVCARFETRRENFGWYKVAVTRHAAQLEFGFDLSPDSFEDRQLGTAVLDIVEAARIDAVMLARYPGIVPAYRQVAADELSRRPALSALPARQALLEGLIQASLGGEPHSSRRLRPLLDVAIAALASVQRPDAALEDVTAAARTVYDLALSLPDMEPSAAETHAPEDSSMEQGQRQPGRDGSGKTAGSRQVQLPPPVQFRLPAEAEPSEDSHEEDARPPARPLTGPHVYPEWDFRAGAYKPRWCRAVEQVLDEGTSDFYVRALNEHRALVADLRERFQHFFPELFRKVPRRYDGEDFDLDALVELVADLRAGHTPSEKIYWRRERTQRDVAVAVLLDMSATTAEYIVLKGAEANRPVATTAGDYSSYLARLASGVDARGKPIRKQTITIEKEAAIVLMEALEAIGDSYALYAFSGSGRDAVLFNIVKDFPEQLDQRVGRRIDRVAPSHATRMGTAIRHATHKLRHVEAQTRLLVLVSDGRPYDRDYGRDDHDQDYAVRDTRQALDEAVRHGIRPFCLTVDKSGGDYLAAMCADVPYEVVDNVEDLPIKLLAAYPKLTA